MSQKFEYVISGFSDLLNWRSVRFEESLPAVRLCSVCGVLPKLVILLPCGHTLCGFCSQGSIANDRICPLDRKGFRRGAEQELIFSTIDNHKVSG